MTQSELIHMFFDEGLEGVNEDVLFTSLSNDRELRKEFLEHMKISSMVQQDIQNVRPSADVSRAIFSNIGIPYPGAEDEQPKAAFFMEKTKTKSFFSRLLPLLALFLVTGTGIYGVSQLFTNSNEFADPNESAFSEASPYTALSGSDGMIEQTESAAEVVESEIGGAAPSPSTPTPAAFDRAIARDAKPAASGQPAAGFADRDEYESNTLVADTPDEDIADAGRPIPYNTEMPALSGTNTSGHPGENPLTSAGPYSRAKLFPNLAVQVRTFHASSPLDNEIVPLERGLMKNFAVGVSYKFADNHSVGLEYGREFFGRRWTETILVLNDGPITSDPEYIEVAEPFVDGRMLDWYGVTLHSSWIELSLWNIANPFTQVFAGNTKSGALGRGMVGLELYPLVSSRIMIGYEYSILNYDMGGSYFQTEKHGLTMGVAVAF